MLKTAKEEQGRITPGLVALKSELSIAEAQKILENMVQMGYALMNIKESGHIEYEFPEFVPLVEEKGEESGQDTL